MHYQDSLQFLAVSVFSEVDGCVGKDAVQTQVFSFEYGGFGATLDFADFVDGFLRHHQVAGNYYGNRIEAYGMCNRPDSCLVVAEFGEVAVAEEGGLFGFVHPGRYVRCMMRQFPKFSPDFFLKVSSEQEHVIPLGFLSYPQYLFKGYGSGRDVAVQRAVLRCLSSFPFSANRLRNAAVPVCLCEL